MVDSASPAAGAAKDGKARNRWVAGAITVFKFVAGQYLLIMFGLACLFGYLWPNVAAHGGIIKSEYSILYGAVSFIFLVSGLQISHQKLLANIFNWRLHIITQGISFILIPCFQLIIVHIIIAAGDLKTEVIDIGVLVGMIVVSCIPTTIASNVIMTRNAGGDDAAAIVEVILGNVVGAFLTPGLVFAFMPNNPEFEAWRPASPSTAGSMYARVSKQLGLTVLLPLAVGQTVRYMWTKQTTWVLTKFYIPKIATVCLAMLVWVTFSGAFQTDALYTMSKYSIIFLVLFNIIEYVIFTLICFYSARPPEAVVRFINGRVADSKHLSRAPDRLRRAFTIRRMSQVEMIAICFCGAAKTTSLGIPLVEVMWANVDNHTRAYIQVPVLLYTIEQVFMAQIQVYLFKWYMRRTAKDVGGDLEGSNEDLDTASGPREEQQQDQTGNQSGDTATEAPKQGLDAGTAEKKGALSRLDVEKGTCS